MKSIVISAGVVLVVILAINTVRKCHICNHEAPIPAEKTVTLTSEMLDRFLQGLRFKTISTDEKVVDFEPYKQFWKFVLEHYPSIFKNDDFVLTWVDELGLIT